MHRIQRTTFSALGIALSCALIAGCSSGGKTAPANTTSGQSGSSRTSAGHTSAPSSSAAKDLGALILAAPDGFAISTSSDVHNGPVSPADFDRQVGGALPSASSLGYVTGYDVTYDASASSDSLEVTLFRFTSASAAAHMQTILESVGVDPQEKPARTTARGIPNSVALDATTAASDGTYDHGIIATKGNIVMGLFLNTDHAGATPANLLQWATAQYRRL